MEPIPTHASRGEPIYWQREWVGRNDEKRGSVEYNDGEGGERREKPDKSKTRVAAGGLVGANDAD